MLSDYRKVWGWADGYPGMDDVKLFVLNCWVTKNVEKKLTFAWQLLNEKS